MLRYNTYHLHVINRSNLRINGVHVFFYYCWFHYIKNELRARFYNHRPDIDCYHTQTYGDYPACAPTERPPGHTSGTTAKKRSGKTTGPDPGNAEETEGVGGAAPDPTEADRTDPVGGESPGQGGPNRLGQRLSDHHPKAYPPVEPGTLHRIPRQPSIWYGADI